MTEAPAAIKRMLGSARFVLLFQAAGAFAGGVAGLGACKFAILVLKAHGLALPRLTTCATLIGIITVLGWGSGLALAQRTHRHRFLAALRERGTPAEAVVTYRLADTALEIDNQRTRYGIRYEAIL